jgi:hypothetical protein
MKKKIVGILALLVLLVFIGAAWAAVTATWDKASGIVTGHKIYFRLQSDPSTQQVIDTGQADTTYDLTSAMDALPPGIYEFWVTAYNVQLDGTTKQEGGPSNIVTYVKEVPIPGACSNFRLN